MNIRRSVFAPVAVALVALVTGGWFLQQGVSRESNIYAQTQLLREVLEHISERYVDETEPSMLIRMAIDGLLRELGDPHTAFMTPKEYDDLRLQTQGEYGGLGIEIDVRDGWVTVISPLPNTPAERAGLMSGDRIIEVDGVSTEGWTTQDAVDALRGMKGEPVNLLVSRVGMDDPIPFRIVRDEIHITAIESSYMMEDSVGYVELRVFSENSTEELRDAIRDLRRQGMKGLVLDLRRNPGGLLDQGVAASDLFLNRGELILETRSRVPSQNYKFTAMNGDQFPNMPIVVLMSSHSASASEILAGALQDHDRGLVIGETSFGKGSVQTLYPLSGDNFLKLTTARWYTPSGRSIQKPIERPSALTAVSDRADSAAADSANGDQPREEYRTAGGRIVYGGGGIHPDIMIGPDTVTAEELEFATAVQRHGSTFWDVVFNFAVQYTRDNPDLDRDFEVTPEMLDSFYTALMQAGIEVDRGVFDGAQRWIEHQLGARIAYSKWGRQEARRWQNRDDPQVRLAHDLLRQARTPAQLIELAANYNGATSADGSSRAAADTGADQQ